MSKSPMSLIKTCNLVRTRALAFRILNNSASTLPLASLKTGAFHFNNCEVLVRSVRHARTDSSKCWKCGIDKRLLTELFCEKCSVIQSPFDRNNYFHVLDVEESYAVNEKELKNKYRQLQTLLHPDKFTNRTEKEKTISEDYSSLVNKAYNTLQSPLSRAIHMLKLRNISIDEDQKISDKEFLMEIMELNEEVEGADSLDKIHEVNEKNKKSLQECEKEILDNFTKCDVEEVKKAVIKMKYYDSLSSRINNLMRERGIVS